MSIPRTYQGSIVIDRSPDEVYALVSDVTRTGEWSPICRGCEWDDEPGTDGPQVGAWFTGHNVQATREWSTRSQVVTAEPGREFAWEVANGWVHWSYTLEPVDAGTRLTESWHFLDAGVAGFAERFGDKAQAHHENRWQAVQVGIPATLAAIKRIAESA